MKCKDIQFDLALYGDDLLSAEATSAIESHFESCPVCRAKNAANREIRNDLRFVERPRMSEALNRSLRNAVAAETRRGSRQAPWLSTEIGEWFQMRLMPYAVGVLTSLIVGFSVLTIMFTNARTDSETAFSSRPAGRNLNVMLAVDRNSSTGNSPDQTIYPADYARTRTAVSGESPSLNPQGALVAMTGSFVRKNITEDGVVVVAEVFSNGLAQIKEVVDPSRDSKAISDLEKALDAELGNAPFLPASLDNRSDSVRVVLRFQSVDVSTKERTRSRRRS